MIKRILMSLVAIMFPWLIILLEDNPGGAVVALIMQASIIGWPFAAVWALRTVKETRKAQLAEKKSKKEQRAQEKAAKQEEKDADTKAEQ